MHIPASPAFTPRSAGAEVTHVDASKKAIAQAFENRDTAGMQDAPIRFITEDATRFVEREIRRGRHYDGIILDPPKYGRGPKGERWRIETDLVPLLDGCRQILSDTPRFLLLTIYAIRASSQAAHYALSDVMAGAGGTGVVRRAGQRRVAAGAEGDRTGELRTLGSGRSGARQRLAVFGRMALAKRLIQGDTGGDRKVQ